MAVKVKVKNFQSLRNTGLEISGFTAITGPNNSGKTALMRAIRGVFQNSPGTSFVSHGADEMEVSIAFGDGRSVVWSKGTSARSKPTYVVDGGKPIHPGRGVPDEVAELGVTPIRVMGKEVWPSLAAQFTGQVFLLDQPGSSLAEAVADVERVARLNDSLRAADRDLRAATSRLKVRKDDQVRLEAEVLSFEGLDAVIAQVAEIDQVHDRIEKMERALDMMTTFRKRLIDARGVVSNLARVGEVSVPETKIVHEMWSELEICRNLDARLKRSRVAMAACAGIERVEVVVVPHEQSQKILNLLNFLSTARKQKVTAHSQVTSIEAEAEASIEETRRFSQEVTDLLTEMGDCPTCGQSLGAHTHDE